MRNLITSLMLLVATSAVASPFASAPITNFDPNPATSHLECIVFLVADNTYDSITMEIDDLYGNSIDQRTCLMNSQTRFCYSYAFGIGTGICKVKVNTGAKGDFRGSLALVGTNGTGALQTITVTPVE